MTIRRARGAAYAIVGILSALAGCATGLAPTTASITAPHASTAGSTDSPAPGSTALSKAARLTPGDMLGSRAMQGAPFYVIHDEGHMLACRRWVFAEGQLGGDDVTATIGEASGGPSRRIRIDTEASIVVVGGAGTSTVRYTVTAEDDGLALWLGSDRNERRMLFHSADACQAAAHREERRLHGSPVVDAGDESPIDRAGPPGPR